MNNKKIHFVSVFALLWMASCSLPDVSNGDENREARDMFEKCAKTISQKSDWLSFVIEHHINGEKAWSNNVSLCYEPNEQACYIFKENAPVKITHYGFYMYNTEDNNLFSLRHCEGEEIDNPYLSYKSTEEINSLSYLSALFMSPMNELKTCYQLRFTSVSDTIARATPCLKLTAVTPKSHWKSRRGDTVVEGVSQELCHFYINKNTEMVDSLVAIEQLDTTNTIRRRSVVIKDISFEDKSVFFDSVFDFNSDRFRNYTIYDEYMWSRDIRPTNSVTGELLDYPMVNLMQDTSFLKDEDGYVLLNMWTFSCPSCINNLSRYKKQTDSLGYRILEKEGIKILAINYHSNNMDRISEIAQKTSTCDIMFSAKGMDSYISTPYQGYYYLLSPAKEIIYETYSLDDYSELLEAKANYEKQHQNE